MSTKVLDCATCGQSFSSRNQLFKHLKELGHGVQTADDKSNSTSSDKSNKTSIKERGNEAYYKYYLQQKIINTEDSDAANEQLWNDVYKNLRSPLPITYRIQESSWVGGDFSSNLLTLVAKDELQSWNMGGDDGAPKIRITMTKECHHFNKSRNESRNRDSKLSSLLHALQELGATYRQELVSAIPPLVLWSCSGSNEKEERKAFIADLCAAPGSKSLQLLDLLHSMEEKGEVATGIPNGLLVVNDSDRNRIVTLCQRSRRVPRGPMLAINMDARYYPGIRRKSGYKQKYDKVLADVPCSGDGTSRKNKHVWTEWSIPQAMSLHKLQRKILRRGLELLRPGGLLVYSTCSLNPLENEAVVSSVIDDLGGTEKVKIVALPAWLTSKFKAMKGLSTWLVPTSKYGKAHKEEGVSFEMYECFADVPAKLQSGKITPSMFPVASDLELKNQLKHCARFVPIKDNIDSGGFFVACLVRLQVGELGEKPKIDKKKSDVDPKSDVEHEPAKRAKVSNDDTQMQTGIEADASAAAPFKSELLREGDWICEACGKLNFGRRDSRTCFGCKKRKSKAVDPVKKVKMQPLLKAPCLQTEMEPFLNYFGISSSNSAFENVRVIHRKRERTFTLVSAPIAALSISEQWGAFREAGISLITMPIRSGEEESENAKHTDITTLFDEAVPILALHAKKRHIAIDLLSFQTALAQAILEDLKKETAETERIKTTLDIPLTPLCGNEPWYEPHEVATESGVFIVSCSCSLKGGVGRFSFWCRRHDDGRVTVETTSRVLAAMLLVVHTYLEEVSAAEGGERNNLS